jgi:membrane protease subunit HflC
VNRARIITGAVIALVILLAIVFFSAAVVIDETEQAVIVRLGRPVHVIVGDRTEEEWKTIRETVTEYSRKSGHEVKLSRGAGLYMKTPFVEVVRIFENRILEYDVDPGGIVTRDKQQMNVDYFAKWRIVNPLLLLQAATTELNVRAKLDDIVFSVLKENLSRADRVEIVRTSNDLVDAYPERPIETIRYGRGDIMAQVLMDVKEQTTSLGIEVIDVRIKRADLLPENKQAVFDRMNAERHRISEQFRAEGKKEQQRIEAETDREIKVIRAEAQREAEILIGEGEAGAAAIYAAAYDPHRDFYSFSRRLEALRRSVDAKTRMVIGTDSPLFRYLKDEAGK